MLDHRTTEQTHNLAFFETKNNNNMIHTQKNNHTPVSDSEVGSLDIWLNVDAREVDVNLVLASDDTRGALLVCDSVLVDNMAVVRL